MCAGALTTTVAVVVAAAVAGVRMLGAAGSAAGYCTGQSWTPAVAAGSRFFVLEAVAVVAGAERCRAVWVGGCVCLAGGGVGGAP